VTTTERNIHLGVLGASLALTVWVFGAQPRAAGPATRSDTRSPATERSPLSIVPPGSAFLFSADLRALARAPLGAHLAEAIGHTAGVSKLSQSCGFDPLARLDQLALAAPSANLAAYEELRDFGVVVSGRFSAEEILRCASAAISARGGEMVRAKLGSFEWVRERRAGSGSIAAKDGLLIVSGGSYFRDLLGSAETTPRAGGPQVQDARHAELRAALGPGPLIATWLLGEGWFERATGGEINARLSPLSTLKTFGARIEVGHTAQLLVLLDCADSEGATRMSSLLGELSTSLKAIPLDPRLSGIAARIKVSQSGARLKLALELNEDDLAPVLEAFAP